MLRRLLSALALSIVAVEGQGALPRTVEQLPVDRFDEYPADAPPPAPWRVVGETSDDGLTLHLSREAESPFAGNEITGKGVLLRRAATAEAARASAGAGGAVAFKPPPPGHVYLGFDFKLEGAPLRVVLADEAGRGLEIGLGLTEGCTILARDGARVRIAAVDDGVWYHLGITLSGTDDNRVAAVRLYSSENRAKLRKPSELQPVADRSGIELPLSRPLGELRFVNPPVTEGEADDVGAGATVGWMIDNICMAGEVAAPRAAEWFPFSPAPAKTLRESPRKVFAYYYPPYPTDRKTSDPGLSNYVLTTLNPSAPLDERRKGAGTKIFYHPLPRPPFPDTELTPEEQRIRAAEEDVRLAIEMGADGFVVDLFSYFEPRQAWYNERAFAVIEAARRVDPEFLIIPAVYSRSGVSGIRGEADAKVDPRYYAASPVFKVLAESPSVLRTPDGRMVFSHWLSERHSAGWWKTVMEELEKRGIPTVFLAHFNSTLQLESFAPVSHGFAHWGPRSPVVTDWIETARAHTPLVVAPVAPHDIRSRGTLYWEAANFDALRVMWTTAIEQRADWVFINTWSDHTEQAMVPSTAIGFAPYDLCAYYTHWFKLGAPPTIVRDVLYYSHRRHHTELEPTKGAPWRLADGGLPEARNEIELLAFLKEAGELQIVVDGRTHTRRAEAGVTSFKVPLPSPASDRAPAAPVFRLLRDGRALIDEPGRYAILNEVDFANLLYHSGVLVASPQP